jgi:hypothetical protein
MLGKVTGSPNQPTRTGRLVEVMFRGKTYVIYSPQQFESCLQIAKVELINLGIPDELVEDKAKSLMEERGVTTMESLLARMTPEEKEEINNRYRYGGLWKSNP